MELLTRPTQKHLLIALPNSEALVSHCGKPRSQPAHVGQCKGTAKPRSTVVHIFYCWNEKQCFVKIYTLSYYYYNSCMTFMFNCWPTGRSKLFGCRRKTEKIVLLCPILLSTHLKIRHYANMKANNPNLLDFICFHFCFLLHLWGFDSYS